MAQAGLQGRVAQEPVPAVMEAQGAQALPMARAAQPGPPVCQAGLDGCLQWPAAQVPVLVPGPAQGAAPVFSPWGGARVVVAAQ